MRASDSPRVVIIGGGFAGASCARRLERQRPDLHITLIDRRNYAVFYPLLIEAGTGSLEPRHIVVPIRSYLRSGAFAMCDVTGVDFNRREVRTTSAVSGTPRTYSYDHLVLAPGSVTSLPPVSGLQEHALQLKSLADAVALRDRAVAMLEAANMEPDRARRRELLHFIVVGGNFTGVEVAGELDMFLRRALRHYDRVGTEDFGITLAERDSRILPSLSRQLAGYALENLRRRGIHVLLDSSVEAIDGTRVRIKGGDDRSAGTVIWCAGIAPSPLVAELDLPVDERGYILCEPDCRVKGRTDVWALGDAAVNVDADGNSHPPTAQHAVRQGVTVADNIGRICSDRDTVPLRPGSSGSLAALGCRAGVAEIKGIRISGFLAWWLYRTVYLMKMPGLGRKARVALDWTLDLLFPADAVQLGLHRGGETRLPLSRSRGDSAGKRDRGESRPAGRPEEAGGEPLVRRHVSAPGAGP